jgi:hypothetical protein
MRAGLLTILFGGCAYVTPAELADWRADCTCGEGVIPYYRDQDGDGWGNTAGGVRCQPLDGWVENPGDCDDENPAIHPDAEEVCNGLDDDCDGATDERGASGETRWYQDADGDGWGDETVWLLACTPPSGYMSNDQLGDCDDDNPQVHPGLREICDNLVDDDCDGDAGDCRLQGDLSWSWADVVVVESTAGEGLGEALAGGPDLHGDAQGDLVLGAPGWVGPAGAAGAVLVFPGPFGGERFLDSTDATTTMLGSTEAAPAGRSLALLPNHAGDGATWIALGCAPADPTEGDAGAVYLVSELTAGTTTVLASAAAPLDDAPAGAAFGFALDGGADASDDGRADLLVGAPGTNEGTGEARLFLGPVSAWGGLAQAEAVFTGPSAGAMAGASVALCPDVDGDGVADVLVGAPQDAGHGAAALFLAAVASAAWGDADAHYLGTSPGDEAGIVASAGDTDGDGYGDFLVGAPGWGGYGKVWLLLGSAFPPSSLAGATASVVGLSSGDRLGASLAAAGDFDADGHADLMLGSPGADDPAPDAGSALLFYGPVAGVMDAADAGVQILGPASGAQIGTGLGGAGDLDQDGFSDLLVGASGAGQVALFFGQGW